MPPERQQTEATARFKCLGSECPDTCCKGWGMQLTQQTVDKYKAEAPELLDAVTSGESEFIMKRDPATDYCVKFDNGWCAIHRDYGEDFLGDACHFYPRITRALGERVVTSVALSCPESARLMLFSPDAFALTAREEVRVPFSLKDYLPENVSAEDAIVLHERFLAEAGNKNFSAERNLMRIAIVARALEAQPPAQWPAAAEFYFKSAEGRVPIAEASTSDFTHILHGLQGLIAASKISERPRLMDTIDNMAAAMGAVLDWKNLAISLTSDAPERVLKMLHIWRNIAQEAMAPVLQRYLQAQLSEALFPFAGLGETLSERITIIGVRFATVKLALMGETVRTGKTPVEHEVVRIVQSLSRFLDHLADAKLSMSIYRETGWIRQPRLRALIGDE